MFYGLYYQGEVCWYISQKELHAVVFFHHLAILSYTSQFYIAAVQVTKLRLCNTHSVQFMICEFSLCVLIMHSVSSHDAHVWAMIYINMHFRGVAWLMNVTVACTHAAKPKMHNNAMNQLLYSIT